MRTGVLVIHKPKFGQGEGSDQEKRQTHSGSVFAPDKQDANAVGGLQHESVKESVGAATWNVVSQPKWREVAQDVSSESQQDDEGILPEGCLDTHVGTQIGQGGSLVLGTVWQCQLK